MPRHEPSYLRASGRRRNGRASTVLLTLVVVTWWLFIGAAIVILLPPLVASAPRSGASLAPDPFLAPGSMAQIKQPGIPNWPIPVERAAFDTYYRGARESDEAAIDAAFEMSEWIEASDRQPVRIVQVDGEAVQVELVDGAFAGRRGWVKPRHLVP